MPAIMRRLTFKKLKTNKKVQFFNEKIAFFSKIDKKSENDCCWFVKILSYMKYPQAITIKSFITSANNCLDL